MVITGKRSLFFGTVGAQPSDDVERLQVVRNEFLRQAHLPDAAQLCVRDHLAGYSDMWCGMPQGGNETRPAAMVAGHMIAPAPREDANAPAALATFLGRAIGQCHLEDFESIDGPFLVAATRPERSEAILVRDKIGLRPLYYTLQDRKLWFADDVRLLLGLRHFGTRRLGLIEWLYYGVPLEPLTCFEDIRALAPGHALVFNWRQASLTERRYFDPCDYVSPEMYRELAARDAHTLERDLERRLDDAIARATASAPDVTVLVSGGVDSGLVAAFAARHADVTAVTIDVQGPDADSELPYARAVAGRLQLTHCICPFGRTEFREAFCDTVHALGTPIVVENAVALLYAARSRQIPLGQLILDGEGADALLCGAPNVFRYSMFTMLAQSRLPFSTQRIRAGLEWLRAKLARLGLATTSTLDSPGLDVQLTARNMEIQKRMADLLDRFAHVSDLAQREICALTLREFSDYVSLLTLRLDRMAQAAEAHLVLPFLDRHVFRFSQNLPVDRKIRWDWRHGPLTKWLPKRLAARHLPAQVVYRPKGGFHIPGPAWVGDMPAAWQQDSWVAEQFQLKRDTLQWWLSRTQSRDRLFLLSMEVWGRLFGRHQPLDGVREQWLSQP